MSSANTSTVKFMSSVVARFWHLIIGFSYQFLLLEMVIFVTNCDGPDDLSTEHDAIAATVSLQK